MEVLWSRKGGWILGSCNKHGGWVVKVGRVGLGLPDCVGRGVVGRMGREVGRVGLCLSDGVSPQSQIDVQTDITFPVTEQLRLAQMSKTF